MRTIKFRGKRIGRSKGAWAFGNLCVCSAGAFIGTLNPGVAVDPGTVGQFSGFTDYHCKEIYEGDILFYPSSSLDDVPQIDNHAYREVVFHRGGFCLRNWFATTSMANHRIPVWIVVGNIFDNPELVDLVNGKKKEV